MEKSRGCSCRECRLLQPHLIVSPTSPLICLCTPRKIELHGKMNNESIIQIGRDALSFGSQLSKAGTAIDDKPPVLLVHREPNANIDMTNFSFAKPSLRQNGFSLRNIPKKGTINHSLLDVPESGNPMPTEPAISDGFVQKYVLTYDVRQYIMPTDLSCHV